MEDHWYCWVHSKHPTREFADHSQTLRLPPERTASTLDIAMRPGGLRRLGSVPSQNCAHREWAGAVLPIWETGPRRNRIARRSDAHDAWRQLKERRRFSC